MNQTLLSDILALVQKDVETRSRLRDDGELYGRYDERMQQVHRDNAHRLDGLIARHGWPGVSLVGEEGADAAWLVAQHAICTPVLQRRFLVLLTAAAQAGEVPSRQVAMLTDRIRFHEERPQVFGTVLDWDETGQLSCKVEDPENLDRRRAAVGLGPFQDNLQRQRDAVAAEGGACPVDFARYKAEAHAWAESVGWFP